MNRRNFIRLSGAGTMALHTFPASSSFIEKNKTPVPLGIGNHSLRALRPNASELISFAIEHNLDSVQFNTLNPFESIDELYLTKLKKHADRNDVSIYVGVGSISELSNRFSDDFGDADNLVKEGIRVAKALGSPILGVRIGVLDDRYSPGGIQPKMEEVINRMRSFRDPVLDAGMKFAFENHAGDMRTDELLELIDATGSDICGAFFDPGNAVYAMEDPEVAMKTIGRHIICCQARDVVIWPDEKGAVFQWTAVGEGMMDFRFVSSFLKENCPGVPIHIETISHSPRSLPYLTDEFWMGFPELKASEIIDFLKMTRKGDPIEVAQAPTEMAKKAFEMENQKEELLRSIRYLREECGAGLK